MTKVGEQTIIIDNEVMPVREAIERRLITYTGFSSAGGIITYEGISVERNLIITGEGVTWKIM